ncbi:MAG TPA: DUF3050 domain-containing protein, partial [Pirellulales bacterium]
MDRSSSAARHTPSAESMPSSRNAPLMNLSQIRCRIAPLRQSLLEHPLYEDLGQPAALRVFMQHHIFAVWDFM